MWKLEYSKGSDFFRLFQSYQCKPKELEGYTRQKINGFSWKSRKRLFDLFAAIPFSTLERKAVFVTLTYPSEFPTDWTVYKGHLQSFRKRLEREHGELPVVWKLEFQQRGAPHYHLMIFKCSWVDMRWLARSWFEIVGSNDTDHFLAGTSIERIKSYGGVMYYAGKYMSKTVQTNQYTGRFWGIWNKKSLGIQMVTKTLTSEQEKIVREKMCNHLDKRGYSHLKSEIGGITVYGIRELERLVETGEIAIDHTNNRKDG